jgi:hypothetical protein
MAGAVGGELEAIYSVDHALLDRGMERVAVADSPSPSECDDSECGASDDEAVDDGGAVPVPTLRNFCGVLGITRNDLPSLAATEVGRHRISRRTLWDALRRVDAAAAAALRQRIYREWAERDLATVLAQVQPRPSPDVFPRARALLARVIEGGRDGVHVTRGQSGRAEWSLSVSYGELTAAIGQTLWPEESLAADARIGVRAWGRAHSSQEPHIASAERVSFRWGTAPIKTETFYPSGTSPAEERQDAVERARAAAERVAELARRTF